MSNIFTLHLSSGINPDLFSEVTPSNKALDYIEQKLKEDSYLVKSFEEPYQVVDTILPQQNGQLPLFVEYQKLVSPKMVILGLTVENFRRRRYIEYVEKELEDDEDPFKEFDEIEYYEKVNISTHIEEVLVPNLINSIKEKSPEVKIVLFSTRFDDNLAEICFENDIFFAGGLSTDLILSTCKGLLSSEYQRKETVVRTIEFPPEFTQAGVSILSYFGSYIQKEYKNEELKVAIQQENDTITLLIETPDGEIKEKVEKSFDSYGKVLRGEIEPEDFVDDKLKQMELKSQLRIAALQVEQKNELLQMSRKQHDRDRQRIDRLESRVDNLSSMVEKSFDQTIEEKQNLLNSLENLIHKSDSTLKNSLEIIKEQLESEKSELDEEKLKEALANVRAKDPGMFKTLFTLMIRDPLTSSFGSLIYNVLVNLAGGLPK